jgi:hypothetical protein
MNAGGRKKEKKHLSFPALMSPDKDCDVCEQME